MISKIRFALLKAATQKSSDELNRIFTENEDLKIDKQLSFDLLDTAIKNDSVRVIVFLAMRGVSDMPSAIHAVIKADKPKLFQECLNNVFDKHDLDTIKFICSEQFYRSSSDIQSAMIKNRIGKYS